MGCLFLGQFGLEPFSFRYQVKSNRPIFDHSAVNSEWMSP